MAKKQKVDINALRRVTKTEVAKFGHVRKGSLPAKFQSTLDKAKKK